MPDLTNPTVITSKGVLFLVLGILSSALLLIHAPTVQVAILMGIAIWSFCRFYYFAFYVIEHYVDPHFRFAGLWAFARYMMTRHLPASRPSFMSTALGFQRIKVIALSVTDLDRATRFYGTTLELPPAYEGDEQVGFLLGETILMLKAHWYAPPTQEPNPRITIATGHAPSTEKALKDRGVRISDPVQAYDEFHVGSFLDSEGNKLWFCSPVL